MSTNTLNAAHSLGPVDRIPFGEGRQFDVNGTLIAVFRPRNGEVRATQAECPHKMGRLADGLMGGTTLICPLHGWKFNLATGEAIMGDCGVQTYRCWVDGDGIVWVEV